MLISTSRSANSCTHRNAIWIFNVHKRFAKSVQDRFQNSNKCWNENKRNSKGCQNKQNVLPNLSRGAFRIQSLSPMNFDFWSQHTCRFYEGNIHKCAGTPWGKRGKTHKCAGKSGREARRGQTRAARFWIHFRARNRVNSIKIRPIAKEHGKWYQTCSKKLPNWS